MASAKPDDGLLLVAGYTLIECGRLAAGLPATTTFQPAPAEAPATQAPATKAPAAPAPAAPEKNRAMEPTYRFTGESDKSTQRFPVRSREWRVRSRATLLKDHDTGLLSVRVLSASTGRAVASFQAPQSGGEDVYYVRSEPGEYYLEISSLFMSYAVYIEE